MKTKNRTKLDGRGRFRTPCIADIQGVLAKPALLKSQTIKKIPQIPRNLGDFCIGISIKIKHIVGAQGIAPSQK
jgi:hypothetical protein